jgi:hypothetical protein
MYRSSAGVASADSDEESLHEDVGEDGFEEKEGEVGRQEEEEEEELLKNQPSWVRYMPRTGWQSKEQVTVRQKTTDDDIYAGATSSKSKNMIGTKALVRGVRGRDLQSTSHPYASISNDSQSRTRRGKVERRKMTATETALLLELSHLGKS